MTEYIKREAALSAQNKSMNLAEMRKRLERIPAADVVERKTGKWETDEIGCAICSACGNFAFETTTHHISGWYPRFCPNCGAKMIGGDDDVL